MPIVPEDRPLPQAPAVERRVEYSTCYMCACRCGIQVTLENDELRFIQGTRDHPVNQGVLCAKGSAGIMKQRSPAKLRKPLRRKAGALRGRGEFEEIEWDEALAIVEARLRRIRATDPRQLAFFTGRDQMQALTGLWAQQFGTPNWAAHGGFCSVNMAAAGLYSIGFSFWEFGAPDFDRAKYFVLWGVAEDHSSNPIKIGLDKLKRRGAKFVSINPIRTGYSAIADEWVPIRPGTDGLLALAMVHVLLRDGTIDYEFLARYTNAPWLVIDAPATGEQGLFARDPQGRPLVHDEARGAFVSEVTAATRPALFGSFTLADGRRVKTVLSHAAERYLADDYAPAAVAERCGVSTETIERLAQEMAHVAFREAIELPIAWTDAWGRQHGSVVGRPVAMFAMRGISAHSNGFQTCRALHLLQMLLGALDGPGNFRARAPYPKPIPPHQLPATRCVPGEPLARAPLGFPMSPDDLAIDGAGTPLRIDKAYSWESPIAAHGLMHMVIANAVAGDPYPIDTLLLFMANMAWNSAMNTGGTRDMLCARHPDGTYKIPFVIVCDAFESETVAFGHDVPRALRCDFASRSADLRAGCARRRHPASHPAARSRRASVAGRAGRARVAIAVPGVHPFRWGAQVRRLSGFHRPLRARAGHRLPRRMARCARRRAPGRCAQSGPVGSLQEASRLLRVSPAGLAQVASVRESRIPRIRAGRRLHRRGGADRHADLVGAAAEIPAGGTGRPTPPIASDSRRTSIRCRSGTPHWKPARRTARSTRCRR